LSVPVFTVPVMHNPWLEFGKLRDWSLHFVDEIDGDEHGERLGLTCFRTKTVRILNGLSRAERRCTIAHETQHILRGPFRSAHLLREELDIDRSVARLLVPCIQKVGHALAFHRHDVEQIADELWVDEATINVRLSALAPDERDYIQAQLATIWV
jgi:hypothetical protein